MFCIEIIFKIVNYCMKGDILDSTLSKELKRREEPKGLEDMKRQLIKRKIHFEVESRADKSL